MICFCYLVAKYILHILLLLLLLLVLLLLLLLLILLLLMLLLVLPGPYLRTGPWGPGPGRHIKKIEIEVWYAGKKGCPWERNLREIYTENNVGTEFPILAIENDLTVKLDFENVITCLLVPKQEEDHFPSGIAGNVELINCTWKLNWT